MSIKNIQKFNELINNSSTILVLQADNPDGDSVASSLALESLLENSGKKVHLYCAVNVPDYLKHIDGWDRISNQIPNKFDMSIIVDCASEILFESLTKSTEYTWVKSKPAFILDHHTKNSDILFADEIISSDYSSTGELIFSIFNDLNYSFDQATCNLIAISILSDTLGLTTESVSYKTLLAISELVKNGANLAKIDNNRRKFNKKSIELVKFKADLLKRIDTSRDRRVATVDILWPEIEKFSHEYNPSMLVLDEMRTINDVEVAIAFKTYPDGKITAKIRTNYGIRIADKIAENFGGGGHPYASGFKITKSNNFDDVKLECIKITTKLLDELSSENI